LGGSNRDRTFFLSRDKLILVSGGEVHAQKCIFLDVSLKIDFVLANFIKAQETG